MANKSTLDYIALILLIAGGLNWLLVAFGFNLVTALFSWAPVIVTIVYVLVGLAALYTIYFTFKK